MRTDPAARRRDNGHWEPPGGVLELDETIESGLRREVREETRAEIEVGPLTGVYKNMRLNIVALVFKATVSTAPEEETPEAQKVAWHPVDRVGDLMNPAYAIRIIDARQGAPSVRAHDGERVVDPIEHPRSPGN